VRCAFCWCCFRRFCSLHARGFVALIVGLSAAALLRLSFQQDEDEAVLAGLLVNPYDGRQPART